MSDPTASMSPGLARQMEIYKAGLAGKTPEQPVSVEELKVEARSVLNFEAFDYLAGGADRRTPFAPISRRSIVRDSLPLYLRDVSSRDLGVEVLGRRSPHPSCWHRLA